MVSDNNIPPVDIDEVMEKIRKEARMRRCGEAHKQSYDTVGAQHSESADLKNNGPTVKVWRSLFGRKPRTATRLKESVFPGQERTTLGDFLKYDDDAFVRHAYEGVLGRGPDPGSLDHYVSELRKGRLSKEEILGRLRYSKEGRGGKNRIRGLLFPFALHTVFRVPVAGYLIGILAGVLSLPLLFRNVRAFQANNNSRLSELTSAVQDQEAILSKKADTAAVSKIGLGLSSVGRQIRTQERIVLGEMRRLRNALEEAKEQSPGTVRNRHIARVDGEEGHLLDAMYVAFEDRFRGTRDDIKARVKIYLPYLERLRQSAGALILDIGCGRGEWLELLKDNGYRGLGVELNRVMAQQCRDLGLDVIEADAVSFLQEQPDGSVDVITGLHIIEHLPFGDLIGLFDESLRVLRRDGIVIFETPNPENLLVGACNFYADPTHRHPYPPEPLQFIAEQRGFVKTEILRMHKLNTTVPTGQEAVDEIVRRYNMEQDYALIGQKA